MGLGSCNLQILVSLPHRCYIPNLVKIGPVVLEKKMLTHDARCTMDDGRRRTPIHSIGNLKTLSDVTAKCHRSVPKIVSVRTILPDLHRQNYWRRTVAKKNGKMGSNYEQKEYSIVGGNFGR